jgi:hypothetical protein
MVAGSATRGRRRGRSNRYLTDPEPMIIEYVPDGPVNREIAAKAQAKAHLSGTGTLVLSGRAVQPGCPGNARTKVMSVNPLKESP